VDVKTGLGWMTICERAQNNPDGTMTILRGGINRFGAKRFPVAWVTHIALMLEDDVLEIGQHVLEGYVLSASGDRAFVAGPIDLVVSKKGNVAFSLQVGIPLQRPGLYTLVVTLGELEFRKRITIHRT